MNPFKSMMGNSSSSKKSGSGLVGQPPLNRDAGPTAAARTERKQKEKSSQKKNNKRISGRMLFAPKLTKAISSSDSRSTRASSSSRRVETDFHKPAEEVLRARIASRRHDMGEVESDDEDDDAEVLGLKVVRAKTVR